jgi:hypothetical protein
MSKVAEVILPILIAIGEDRVLVLLNKTRTSSDWTICFTTRRCTRSTKANLILETAQKSTKIPQILHRFRQRKRIDQNSSSSVAK